VAGDAEEFLRLLEVALRSDSSDLVLARQESVRGDTWQRGAQEVGKLIAEHLERGQRLSAA